MHTRPQTGIAVDASCRAGIISHSFGAVEWQGVDLATGHKLFASPVYPEGTNNLAEFMAILDGLKYLFDRGRHSDPVYTDSMNAMAWVKHRKHRSKHPFTQASAALFDRVHDGCRWLSHVRPINPIRHWKKDLWGEIPADYGRKAPQPMIDACTATSCTYPKCLCT